MIEEQCYGLTEVLREISHIKRIIDNVSGRNDVAYNFIKSDIRELVISENISFLDHIRHQILGAVFNLPEAKSKVLEVLHMNLNQEKQKLKNILEGIAGRELFDEIYPMMQNSGYFETVNNMSQNK